MTDDKLRRLRDHVLARECNSGFTAEYRQCANHILAKIDRLLAEPAADRHPDTEDAAKDLRAALPFVTLDDIITALLSLEANTRARIAKAIANPVPAPNPASEPQPSADAKAWKERVSMWLEDNVTEPADDASGLHELLDVAVAHWDAGSWHRSPERAAIERSREP